MNNSSNSAVDLISAPTAGSPPHYLTSIAGTVIIVVIITTAIMGNTLVCIACTISERLKNFTSVFIVNLAISDILVAVMSMPVFLSVQLNGKPNATDSPAIFKAWKCFDILCCTASIMNLVFISVDRFLAICCPLHYLSWVSRLRLAIAVVFIWLYAIAMSALSLLSWRGYALFITIAAFLAPLCIMAAAYAKIFQVAMVHVRNIRIQTDVSIALRQRNDRSFRNDLKAARTLSIVIGAFVILWCPFFVTINVLSYCKICAERASPRLLSLIKWMSYTNSALNPLIYSCLNKNFRDSFVGILKGAFRRICCRN